MACKSAMVAQQRLYTLDYLRGLAALGIMLYHYLGWGYGAHDADSILGRIGVYGVAVFYVLSGLTLYHVYYHKVTLNFGSLRDFFLKRLFRIFPLLWLVMLVSILIAKEKPDTYEIFLNFSGLFSVLDWEEYIGTGVWSIGNELVFYLFFPLFIVLSKRSSLLFYIVCGAILFLHIYFAFFVMYEQAALSKQWSFYVNPLNQVFLFLGGYLIGLWSDKVEVPKLLPFALFGIAAFLFVFYPVQGNLVNLVTDTNRLVFTALSFILCFAFYKSTIKLSAGADKYLKMLGEASYSVYLLHPIIWFFIKAAFAFGAMRGLAIAVHWQLLLSAVLTLLLSHQVYLRYEKFFMQAGKTVARTYQSAA